MIHVRRLMTAALFLSLLLAGVLPGRARAQVIVPEEWSLELSGRVQAQMRHSSVDAANSTDVLLRRVRLKLTVTLNEWLSGRLQPEFAGGARLKDAWVKLSAGDAFQLSMGQFKRAFDPFVLSSSTELSVIERDGRVPGVDACEGVGGTCSLSRFTETLGYAGRDVGARVEGELGAGLHYMATVTNGPGAERGDENDAKSAAGRVTLALTDRLRVGGSASFRDHLDPGGDTDYGGAWGVDVEVGDFRTEGVHLQAGLVGGDNWRTPAPAGTSASFTAVQGILSYHHLLEGDGPVVAVEPVARAGWADPNTDAADDRALLLTPGVMFYFGGRNKIGANVDVFSPETGDTEWSLKLQSFLHF